MPREIAPPSRPSSGNRPDPGTSGRGSPECRSVGASASRPGGTGPDRRSLLASAATVGTALLAGCSSDGGTLDHEVEHDDPGETFLRFSRGGSRVGTAGYILSPPGHGQTRFRFHVFTRVDGVSSVRLRFKPLLPPGVFHRVLLERPSGSPYPEFGFEAGEGYGWTLFEVPDLGAQTPGSYTVEFYVDVFEEKPEPYDVATELSITFDNGWDFRTLRGEAAVVVPGPSDD